MIDVRKIFFACALSWAFLPSYCQKFSIGVKAGPLISWGSFGDKEDKAEYSHKIKPGFYAAGLLFFPLKNKYSFQTEFGFSQRGRKITFNKDSWENSATYYFADASMMLRRSFPLNLGPNIPSQWFVNLGPRVSYWISGKGKVDAGGSYNYTVVFTEMPQEVSEPDFDKMYMRDVNRWLFGIDVGVGFNAPLKQNRKLSTELRFTSGHTFLGTKTSATNRTLGFSDNLRANEKILTLTVAYTIDLNVQESRKGKSTKDREVKRKK